jgi:hypothetical protein
MSYQDIDYEMPDFLESLRISGIPFDVERLRTLVDDQTLMEQNLITSINRTYGGVFSPLAINSWRYHLAKMGLEHNIRNSFDIESLVAANPENKDLETMLYLRKHTKTLRQSKDLLYQLNSGYVGDSEIRYLNPTYNTDNAFNRIAASDPNPLVWKECIQKTVRRPERLMVSVQFRKMLMNLIASLSNDRLLNEDCLLETRTSEILENLLDVPESYRENRILGDIMMSIVHKPSSANSVMDLPVQTIVNLNRLQISPDQVLDWIECIEDRYPQAFGFLKTIDSGNSATIYQRSINQSILLRLPVRSKYLMLTEADYIKKAALSLWEDPRVSAVGGIIHFVGPDEILLSIGRNQDAVFNLMEVITENINDFEPRIYPLYKIKVGDSWGTVGTDTDVELYEQVPLE